MKKVLDVNKFLNMKKFHKKYDAIALRNSFRNRYEQNPSVLEGEGASLVVQGRRHAGQNKSIAAFHLGSPRGENSGQAQALWLAGRQI